MLQEKDKEILAYITNADGKLIPQRCTAPNIERRGWTSYLLGRFVDNSTNSVAEAIYRLYNDIEEMPECANPECRNKLKFNMANKEIGTYCCPKCRNTSPEMIEKNKAGVSKALKKVYEERGEDVKAKRSDTLRERFGLSENVSSPFAIEGIRDKAKASTLEHYGVENVMSLSEFHVGQKEKSRELSVELWKSRGIDIEYTDHDTIIIRNGCVTHGDIELSLSNFNNRTKRDRINTSDICPICNKIAYFSGEESMMAKFLDELDVDYKTNDRTVIAPDELDFYIPSHHLAIEMNGVYFHSEANGKDKNYHKDKSDRCKELGIQLIHVWEDDWANNNDLVKSMIAHRLGVEATNGRIYARDCEFVSSMTTDEMTKFLNENHIQGSVNAKYKYGLRYNGELVAVMTFGAQRIALGATPSDDTVELLRFCGKKWCNIIGGASKLFSHAKDELIKAGKKEIITYAKRDWSSGGVYEQLDFDFVGKTAPGYFYVNKKGDKFNRYSCRKSVITETEEEKNMTEVEIMESRGFYRCFDSGNLKYRYIL